MQGSRALTSMDTKSPEVLSTSHGRGHLLFIAPRAKIVVTPSLGRFQDDRTRPVWRSNTFGRCLWTNQLCISHKHILVHLGCHSITKTKQGPFRRLRRRRLWPTDATDDAPHRAATAAVHGRSATACAQCSQLRAAPLRDSR